MANKTFNSTVNLKEGFEVVAQARGHKVTLDEPERLGGQNKGMNPMELTLSSLGACLAITGKTFARQCGVELENLTVEVEGDMDPRGFKGVEGVAPGFQDVRFKVEITSDSPKENIKELITVMKQQCPVSDSLKRNIEIKDNYEVNK